MKKKKFQENDYDIVIKCLSNHIPKIYDESTSIENEINLNTLRCIKNGTRIEEVRERVKSDGMHFFFFIFSFQITFGIYVYLFNYRP